MPHLQPPDASGRGDSGMPRPLAYRLLASAVAATGDQPWVLADEADIDVVPSGSARLAVLQSVAVAAVAIQQLAAVTGSTPREVLDVLWPAEKRSPEWARAFAGRVVWAGPS